MPTSITKERLKQSAEGIRAAHGALAKKLEALEKLEELEKDIKGPIDLSAAENQETKLIQQRLNSLVDAFGQTLSALEGLRGAINSVSQLLGAPPLVIPPSVPVAAAAAPQADEANFADFLSSVGEAVLDGQRQLDRKSEHYLHDIAKSEFIVPTAFRIPKLSAKMMFELTFEKTKGVNLIFNSRSEAAARRNQQSIEFDIVSVPAPVGSSETIRRIVGIELVFDPVVRRQLLEASDKAADSTDGKENALPARAVDDASRILLLRRSIGVEEKPGFLVIYAGQTEETVDKPNAVGMWIFDSSGLQVVYRFERKNGQFEDRLKPFIDQIAQQQKNLIEEAG
jgi:hypothetical protein